MSRKKVHYLVFVLLAGLVCFGSCSKETTQEPAEEPAPSGQPQMEQPATAAPPAESVETAAAPLKNSYRMAITNRGSAPVTVSLNGQWLGHWDGNVDVPLESAVPGKNELTVELPEAPQKELRLTVYLRKGSEIVDVLSLNFEGKTGTHTQAFVAN